MTSVFVELLHVTLGRKKRLVYTPNVEEWDRIFTIAKQQTLVGVLFTGIEQLPVEQRPPRKLLLKWIAATERIKQNNKLLNRRAVETGKYFHNNGFESCIIKGQGIATYYPNPLLRTSGDIDIWLKGSRKDIYELARKDVGLQGLTYQHIHYPIYKDAEIEVHTTPACLSNPFLNYKLQKYFKETFSDKHVCHLGLPDNAGYINVPTVEFNLFYLLLHMYKHLLGQGIGMRQMMDYYYALQQPITDDVRKSVVNRLKDFKMLRFASATMYVMQNVFGLDETLLLVTPNEKAGRFLLDEIIQAGNFGKYDKRLKRKHNETPYYRLVRSLKRNVRFLKDYPNEVLWDPIFRTWQYFWRMGKI